MADTAALVTYFVCSRCRRIMEGTVDLIKKLCNEVKTDNILVVVVKHQ